jgi:cytochrome c-type biogenesis protein CcmE
MRIRPRFFIGAGLIVVAIAYLIISAVRTTSEYYLTVNEVHSKQTELVDQRLRIAGRVKPGTIGWEPSTLTLKFEMVQIPDPSTAPVQRVSDSDPVAISVVCAGQPKPDMFGPDRDVIVEGTLGAGGLVTATQVMTSCPSKYKPKQAQ